jgi:heme-degrading monooxygenase HmoA
MDLPWSAAGTPPAGQDAYVMASRFELISIWRSPAFLTQAVRAWRQARRSSGVYGVTLRAELLRRRYWTLSAWTGEAALREFARAEPHRTIMRRVRPWARTATFRFWTAPPGQLTPSQLWPEAERRINAPE